MIPGLCEEYDVALGEDKTPFIFIKDKGKKKKNEDSDENPLMWWPICGDFFGNNEYGATLFCNKLGYEMGEIHNRKQFDSNTTLDVPMDSYMIGTCNSDDPNLQKCTGGCNLREIGGTCAGRQCAASKSANIEIECTLPNSFDKPQQVKSSCKSKYLIKSLVCKKDLFLYSHLL